MNSNSYSITMFSISINKYYYSKCNLHSVYQTYYRFSIKLKHMVALTNKVKTMLLFPRIIGFNAAMPLNLIEKPNIMHLINELYINFLPSFKTIGFFV